MGRSAADHWKPAAGFGEAWSEAIQSSAVGMAIISSAGEILQINQAFGDQLGRDGSALQHLRLWDVLHPVEREKCVREVDEILAGLHEPASLKVLCQHSQGHLIAQVWTISECKIPDGSFGLIVQAVAWHASPPEASNGSATDSDQLHRALDHSHAHVCIKDRQGRYLYVNRSLQKALQIATGRESVLGLSDREIFPSPCLESIRRVDEDVFSSGDPQFFEEHFPCADGSERIYLTERLIYRAEAQEPCLVCMSCDVTELKQAGAQLARSEEHFRLLAENSGDVVFLLDLEGYVRWVSPSLTTALGWLPEDWIGRKGTDFILHHGQDSGYQINLQELHSKSETIIARDQILASDGTVHWMETHASPFYNSSGCLEGCVGHFHMVDAMVETETQLRQSEERYRLLAENARDVIWTMEPNGAISYISPSILELRGFTPQEAAAQPLEQIHPPDSLARSQAYFSQLLSDVEAGRRPEAFRSELEYYCKDGSTIWTDVIALPVLDDNGRLVKLLGTSRDITERKRYEQDLSLVNKQLHALATTDELTHIANRRQLESLIQTALSRSDRYGEPVSLVLCDIDFFKAVNDCYGHQTGDQVLIEFSQRIAANLRAGDDFARWGGEEFMILLSHTNAASAQPVAEKLCRMIADSPFAEVGTVTASFGVAEREPGELLKRWIQRVDEALYASKEAGRNTVTLAPAAGDCSQG
ncbi:MULTISPECIES: PAS domain S-box protein [unclassified Cyanobium]|uniref:sensor domain-containing diguanylate cyclase n=1 Tax=unclassified Cyanobium TaxID=2627006 RepID=UPI0020CFC333|nr:MULTISPECIES: PAS domain S-box protein [unclassified Cyanobium]MCP9832771.1 PAS domain S-box protein [Cyanobium sp. La Preciosa 7G6]MCP9935522.1 PAS domain S-box protein [Cyanobium sp. Aljojuca 7A6]